VFLDAQLRESSSFTFGSLHEAACDVAVAIREFAAVGERVLLLLSTEADFVRAFFGCLYAGVIAVPAYPPINNKPAHRARIEKVVRDGGVRLILTEAKFHDRVVSWLNESELHDAVNCIVLAALTRDGSSWRLPDLHPTQTAFLQYTSGSTDSPKGVMVTHGNILANQSLIRWAFGHDERATILSWLPLYHDMGLVGHVLHPFYLGAKSILMAPSTFINQPLRWLQAISAYQVTTSGGPNFGYQLCVDKVLSEQIESLDLSSWKVAYVGSEPVRSATLESFLDKFSTCGFRKEAWLPCYGLAEATLFVVGAERGKAPVTTAFEQSALRSGRVKAMAAQSMSASPGSPPDLGRRLVASGWTGADQTIVIVKPDTRERCAADEVGEIWVRGNSVATGYWGRHAETVLAFAASITQEGNEIYLRTGDLGFVNDEHLYVEGRIKDLIIVRGKNHSPQDIELTVQQSDVSLGNDAGVVFSVELAGEEKLIVVQEVTRHALRGGDLTQTMDRIREHVAREHDLQTHEIVLIKPATLPKTSSGKVQRNLTRERYLAGELDIVAEWTVTSSDHGAGKDFSDLSRSVPQTPAEIGLTNIVKDLLGIDATVDDSFFRLGIDSLTATQVITRVRATWNVALTAHDLYADPTIRGLGRKIERIQNLQRIYGSVTDMRSSAAHRVTVEI
jgi:acyl-CoA synthetase (AMP-forming)/AMP-acid ligase II/acyl carrier protein